MRQKKKDYRDKNKALYNVPEFHNIETLLLSAFIKGSVYGDYTGLVKKGNPTIEQLQEAWINIISDYQQRRNDPASTAELELRQDKTIHREKKAFVYEVIKMLKKFYHDDLVNELRVEGYTYDFTKESYIEDLQKVEAEIASEEAHLEMNGDDKEHTAPTEKGYLSSLIQIQKVLKACPMLTPKNMAEQLTLAEYVEYCNMYDEHIKSLTPKEETEDDE